MEFVLFKFNDGGKIPINLDIFVNFKNICNILDHHKEKLEIDLPEKFKFKTIIFIIENNLPNDLIQLCELLLLNNYLGYELLNDEIYLKIVTLLTYLDLLKLKISYFGPYSKEEYNQLAYFYWCIGIELDENLLFEQTLPKDFFQISSAPNIYQLEPENIENILLFSRRPRSCCLIAYTAHANSS